VEHQVLGQDTGEISPGERKGWGREGGELLRVLGGGVGRGKRFRFQ